MSTMRMIAVEASVAVAAEEEDLVVAVVAEDSEVEDSEEVAEGALFCRIVTQQVTSCGLHRTLSPFSKSYMAELLLHVVVAITSNDAEAEVAGEDVDVVVEAAVAGVVVVSIKPNEVVALLPFLAPKSRLTDRLGKLRKLPPRLYVCIHPGYISSWRRCLG